MALLPAALSHDPVLVRLAEAVPLPPLDASGDVFHDLVGCLVEQQHPARSTKGTYARLLARAGIARLTPADAERFARDALSTARLSAQKRAAVDAAAAAFQDDDTDWASLSDDTVRERLVALPGVGPQTADNVLLFTLGRPDIFLAGDYHLKGIMATLYGIAPTARAMRDVADGWRPRRSHAVRLLLAWKTWQREVGR